MIELNSSCWSCSITGKKGLTYEEALRSEAEAKTAKKANDKASLRKQQIEERRKQRELLAEWRKPRSEILLNFIFLFLEMIYFVMIFKYFYFFIFNFYFIQPFPSGYKDLFWPDWVPRELYWDILTVQCFFENFAEVLFQDKKNPFTLTNIATAIGYITKYIQYFYLIFYLSVSRQTTENTQFYQILDWLMTAMNKSIEEDEGDPGKIIKIC